jgi:3-oxoacyl-[acyl-carrier protein] reductase
MDLKLEGKRALVTGSTSGIGEGIARGLAAEGATVVVSGRRREAAEEIAAGIRDAGGRAVIALGDLTKDDDVEDILAMIEEEIGGIDILVNNAAESSHSNDMETPVADWAKAYDTNVLSGVRLIQKLLPKMQEKGWGRVINISSGAATRPSAGMGLYSTTKAAINNLTVTLAQSVSADGVTINTVSPGVIFTKATAEAIIDMGMAKDAGEAKTVFNDMVAGDIPFRRVGEVEEIADVVVFLASPRASYVHGANIRVDAGYVPTVN